MATKKKEAPKKVAPKKVAPKKEAKSPRSPKKASGGEELPPKTKQRKEIAKEISANLMYDKYKDAEISTHVQQPEKATLVYVDIVNDENEIETHLLDLRQIPQDILESFKGELV